MSRVTVQWKGPEFLAAVKKAAEDTLYAAATVAQDTIVRRFPRSKAASPPGSPPAVKRSLLRNSITAVHARDLGKPMRAAVGTNVRYGRIHELGGVIRARRAKHLVIPLTDKARRALERSGGSARAAIASFGKVRWIPRKSGFLVVKEVKGRRARTEVLFVLKKQVIIPRRPWLVPGVRAAVPRMQKVLPGVFAKQLRSYFRGI